MPCPEVSSQPSTQHHANVEGTRPGVWRSDTPSREATRASLCHLHLQQGDNKENGEVSDLWVRTQFSVKELTSFTLDSGKLACLTQPVLK